jgi:glycosyltransferase involved in cell wall biosynthesis
MKLAFLTRSLEFGGAERQLVLLARGLHERGHEVRVIAFYPGGPLRLELEEVGVPMTDLGKKGRWDVAGFLLRLVRVLRHERPDVLYSYLPVPNVLAVMARAGRPRMKVAWGIRASFMDLKRYDWLSQLSYGLERRLSRFPDLIVANSRSGRNHALARGFPPDRTVVVFNGVDVMYFRPDKEAGRAVRAAWGVGDAEPLIGIVGRLDPMKDHPTFLKAVARLVRERGGPRFVCVGDGSARYKRALESTARSLGLGERVIWAGERSDMPAVYGALDLLCSASYGEGFPNAVAEAMSCGVSCVVTDVGDSAELVGETGLIVPPRDPDALADALGKMLDRTLDAGAAGEAARARIVERFNRAALIRNSEAAVKALL